VWAARRKLADVPASPDLRGRRTSEGFGVRSRVWWACSPGGLEEASVGAPASIVLTLEAGGASVLCFYTCSTGWDAAMVVERDHDNSPAYRVTLADRNDTNAPPIAEISTTTPPRPEPPSPSGQPSPTAPSA
jgi:hypothetical protein